MGETVYSLIGRNLKVNKYTSKDKPAPEGKNINTDLIEYFPKARVKK